MAKVNVADGSNVPGTAMEALSANHMVSLTYCGSRSSEGNNRVKSLLVWHELGVRFGTHVTTENHLHSNAVKPMLKMGAAPVHR